VFFGTMPFFRVQDCGCAARFGGRVAGFGFGE